MWAKGVTAGYDCALTLSLDGRQYNAALAGGVKGAGMGLCVAAPTAYLLHQRWLPFRGLTLPLKAFFVTTATIATGVIAADKSGIAFDVSRRCKERAPRHPVR